MNDSPYILFYRGFAEYYAGRNARGHQQTLIAPSEQDPSLMQAAAIGKAFSYAISNDNTAGLALLHQTEEKIEKLGVSDAEGIYKVAQAYVCSATELRHGECCGAVLKAVSSATPISDHSPMLNNLRGERESLPKSRRRRANTNSSKARFF